MINIQQQADMCKKYKGIVFNKKDCNFIKQHERN